MRATHFNSLSVVSVLFLTMVCTTVPVRADVNITAVQVGDTNEVIISFDATTETNLVRAFALDIQLDNDANIVSVVGLSADYWVYPGSIQITADGRITDIGSISADYADLPGDSLPGPPDGNGVTLECASLYALVGPGSPNAPAKSGYLASLIISKSTCLSITANVSRAGPTGVVMEYPDEVVTVNYPAGCVSIDIVIPEEECMKTSCPEYIDWEAWGKPDCWCYSKQCRGDADGCGTGPFSVAIPELFGLRECLNRIYMPPECICYDFDHIKTGPFRIAIPDLNIFRIYFNKPDLLVPECDKSCYNFWIIPDCPQSDL
ncbi:MAG: hypothetical protein GWN67_21265 [Phycisphaerae bacterium]|nr:hypothetical protein [Phycisphaerae bacterium]NIR67768.1 hypothetical protein [candidate division Zixibacteria bacterium]NIP51761.1 hypothetical protein [Phycisphaerae bacterium]NIS53458.1 hypothetical protein [Phycisphaerae bacterium]NIU10940.1 hypothetical protein [Phycisphaerae bacterium]